MSAKDQFVSYSATRDFLDRLGDFSEAKQRFPDISFGRTYVNITLRPESEGDGSQLSVDDRCFASEIDALFC